jgi:hypothetical protein
MNMNAAGNPSPELLEIRAAEQRQRINESVGELKSSLADLKSSVEENIRERLDGKTYARQHFSALATGVTVLALMAGYGFTGMFTRD